MKKRRFFYTIFNIIDKYDLSKSFEYGYKHYSCSSIKGLGKYNKERFIKLRENYNNLPKDSFYKDIMFYTITIYSFNNQIRFNSKGECNISVGKRDFNKKFATKSA